MELKWSNLPNGYGGPKAKDDIETFMLLYTHGKTIELY